MIKKTKKLYLILLSINNNTIFQYNYKIEYTPMFWLSLREAMVSFISIAVCVTIFLKPRTKIATQVDLKPHIIVHSLFILTAPRCVCSYCEPTERVVHL